jgi:hypothetical protein
MIVPRFPKRPKARWLALAVSLQAVAIGARAAELDGFGGRLGSDTNGDQTYTWGIEYRQPLSDSWTGSLVWLNEGHQPHNHRDGQAAQLWWHTQADATGLVFEVGLGPYRYYDTHLQNAEPDYTDRHAWTALLSVSADWYIANNWFAFLRLNQVEAAHSFNSTSAVLGLGYRFQTAFSAAADGAESAPPPKWEVDALVGERVQNSAHSQTGLAQSLDVRRQISDHFAVSASFIAGQDTQLDWRAGFAAQVWVEQHLTPRFEAGAGLGVFVVSSDDNLTDASSPSNLEALVSASLSYAMTPAWSVRAVWHRIGTGDDHDADIVLLGAGYKF